MHAHGATIGSLILAGGDGTRLQAPTRMIAGEPMHAAHLGSNDLDTPDAVERTLGVIGLAPSWRVAS